MNNWNPISKFAKVRRGASPRPIGDPIYFGGDVGWVRISDVTASSKYLKKTEQYLSSLGESKSVRVDKGDLVMSICGTIGKPIIIDMPACIHDGFVQLYDIKGLDKEYLYYQLQYSSKALEQKGQPGTQVNLNTTIVGNHLIYIPKENKQKKIAKILSTCDSVIEKIKEAIKKYQAIKAGMMNDLFTRGIDPVTKKLRPRYKDAPELYKKSELGMIPKDWNVDSLINLTKMITDGAHFSPVPQEDGLPIGNVKDMRVNNFDYDSCTKILPEVFEELKMQNCSPKVGDVLLSKDGTIGKIIHFLDEREIVILSSIAILRVNELLDSKYLATVLESEYFNKELYKLLSGSALKRITLRDIQKIHLPYSKDIDEQKLISNKLDSIDKKIHTEQNTLKKYEQIKKGLMNDLLTGKKEVKVKE